MSCDDDVFDTDTVDTPVGEYVVSYHRDEYHQKNPLEEYDHSSMAFLVVGPRNSVEVDTLGEAGRAGDALAHFRYQDGDDIERRFAKWRAITGSTWQLVTGTGYGSSQGYWWDWYVLVNTGASYVASDGNTYSIWGPDATPEKIAQQEMEVYEAWATGDVFGYTIVAPDGSDLDDSCWGYYGFGREHDYVLSEARAAIDYDVSERQKNASLVGSGFVGLI